MGEIIVQGKGYDLGNADPEKGGLQKLFWLEGASWNLRDKKKKAAGRRSEGSKGSLQKGFIKGVGGGNPLSRREKTSSGERSRQLGKRTNVSTGTTADAINDREVVPGIHPKKTKKRRKTIRNRGPSD